MPRMECQSVGFVLGIGGVEAVEGRGEERVELRGKRERVVLRGEGRVELRGEEGAG